MRLLISLIQIMIMFDGTTEINLGVLRLPGFYKQRDNRFCKPNTFFAYSALPTLLIKGHRPQMTVDKGAAASRLPLGLLIYA